MESKIIKQAITEESLFAVLRDWCLGGAGKQKERLAILSAFASGSGLEAISPLLDVFLQRGNSVDIIVGIDRNGTDGAAISRLHDLKVAYPRQCNVSVFNAPARRAIFHPKLYLYERRGIVDFVIGSANLTSGGLASNFESLLFYFDVPDQDRLAKNIASIWDMFSNPVAPLKPTFLKALTASYATALKAQLPAASFFENRSGAGAFQVLWQPLSKISLPNSIRPQRRVRRTAAAAGSKYLVMDVLTETRETQMQIPLQIVEEFFGIQRQQAANILVSIWTDSGLSQPILRPVVKSEGANATRLMRRLEMPQIKGLERPLGVVFLKLRQKDRFAFKLLPRQTGAFRRAHSFLEREGQQGNAERRFIIGTPNDAHWSIVKRLLA